MTHKFAGFLFGMLMFTLSCSADPLGCRVEDEAGLALAAESDECSKLFVTDWPSAVFEMSFGNEHPSRKAVLFAAKDVEEIYAKNVTTFSVIDAPVLQIFEGTNISRMTLENAAALTTIDLGLDVAPNAWSESFDTADAELYPASVALPGLPALTVLNLSFTEASIAARPAALDASESLGFGNIPWDQVTTNAPVGSFQQARVRFDATNATLESLKFLGTNMAALSVEIGTMSEVLKAQYIQWLDDENAVVEARECDYSDATEECTVFYP